jgi:hypothetical protein
MRRGEVVMKRTGYILLTVGLMIILAAQDAHSQTALRQTVRDYRQQHEQDIIREFVELLSIPNIASDRENIRLGHLWQGLETFAALLMTND